MSWRRVPLSISVCITMWSQPWSDPSNGQSTMPGTVGKVFREGAVPAVRGSEMDEILGGAGPAGEQLLQHGLRRLGGAEAGGARAEGPDLPGAEQMAEEQGAVAAARAAEMIALGDVGLALDVFFVPVEQGQEVGHLGADAALVILVVGIADERQVAVAEAGLVNELEKIHDAIGAPGINEKNLRAVFSRQRNDRPLNRAGHAASSGEWHLRWRIRDSDLRPVK